MRFVILKSGTPQFRKKKYTLISGKLPYTRTCHVKGLPVSKFTSLQIKIYDIQTKLELGTVFKMGLMILERRRKLQRKVYLVALWSARKSN